MIKIGIAALATTLAAFAGTGSSCDTSPPKPGDPQPTDSGSCNITANRQLNSAGQWYLELDCDLDGKPDSAALLHNENEFPKCIKDTYWQGCQFAK